MNFDLGNASVEVVNDVKRDVVVLERALRGGTFDSRTGISLDLNRCGTEDLQRELIDKKAYLKKYTPKKLTTLQSNKANKRRKVLEEKIKKKLQGSKQFHQFYPKNQRKEKDFQDGVAHEMKLLQDKGYKKDVAEYRHLMRQLDPEDPRVTNIERLRGGRNVRIRR